jgi:polar amino acid transport system substrate-binding protein
MRTLAVTLLAAAVLAAAPACSAELRTPPAAPATAARPLVVGSDLVFEPMEFLQDGKPAGFDYDLAAAIAARLGRPLEFRQTDWGTLLDGVAAGRLDLAMASITDKAARQQVVTFVDYLHVGSSVVVGEHTRDVTGLSDLCGLRLAVQVDTMYADLARDLAATCPAGRPLGVVMVRDTPRNAVKAGQADAFMNDYPVAVADAATGGLRISGRQFEAAPYGIAVQKDAALVKQVQGALYALFADGTYDRLIAKWKLSEGSLKTGAINGGA